jgi:hypothetical protein
VKWLLLAAFVCAHACGGGRAAPARPHGPGTSGGSVAADLPPSEHECDALIEHAVELGVLERAAKQGDSGALIANDQHALAADLTARFRPDCRTLPRSRYACAMAATTLDVLASCDP